MYQIIYYIKFLLKSTNQHGVHSPFVFNLVTKCFYNTSKFDAYKHISAYKKNLLQNKNKLVVSSSNIDFQTTKHINRSIFKIAKQTIITTKKAQLLYRLVRYFKANSILEIGTSLGFATHAMSLGNKESSIITIDHCPTISAFTKNNFEKYQLKNIQLITVNSEDNLHNLLEAITSNNFDFIFINTNHQKDVILNYFETLLKTVHNDSVIIINQIYASKKTIKAWETIKKHPSVTVTIDTYFLGFVFFRKEQAKEDFVIRI